jgi:hypothetical protein
VHACCRTPGPTKRCGRTPDDCKLLLENKVQLPNVVRTLKVGLSINLFNSE